MFIGIDIMLNFSISEALSHSQAPIVTNSQILFLKKCL